MCVRWGLLGSLLAAWTSTGTAGDVVLMHADEQAAWQSIAARFNGEPTTKEQNGKLVAIDVVGLKGDPKNGGQASVQLDPKDGHVIGVTSNGAAFTNDEFPLFARFGRLQRLTLWHNFQRHDKALPDQAYDGSGLKSLAGLPELEVVTWAGGLLGDAGLKEVAQFKSLKGLNIWHDRFTDAGIANLREHPTLESIKMGPTFGSELTDKTLEHLATCPRLKVLKLGETWLTYENGLRHLLARKDTLAELDLDNSLVEPADIERIRSELPKTQVKHVGLKVVGDQLRERAWLHARISRWVPKPLLDKYMLAGDDP